MGLSILDHLPTFVSDQECKRARIRIAAMVERSWTKSSVNGEFEKDRSQQETDFEPLLGYFVENDNCHT
ncbi:hypothetical protein C5Y97_20345 [Blastopirellula marina]|uniref:Uncharacterized protein n=1 Tax=Blastopirellula marina TaxID=124 RepID=A0A2S8FHY1_9BACT|nr:hypothetical protein C5Y98_20335 [Blastopirellula marina]PTL43070.1 hypothetical protein C5Y97_20345 [Blastopirellula marina]